MLKREPTRMEAKKEAEKTRSDHLVNWKELWISQQYDICSISAWIELSRGVEPTMEIGETSSRLQRIGTIGTFLQSSSYSCWCE